MNLQASFYKAALKAAIDKYKTDAESIRSVHTGIYEETCVTQLQVGQKETSHVQV